MGSAKVVDLDSRHPTDRLIRDLLPPGQEPSFSVAAIERELRMKKRPRDPAQLAKMIVDIATGEIEDAKLTRAASTPAAELGRKGGLKGGRARADSLTDSERRRIAKKAAKARWKGRPD